MEPTELLTPTVDKSQVPPLHHKRIVAFLNHFLISSCSFLNDFAETCETRFIELERKMQRLEASLTIIEAKLASIPHETGLAPNEVVPDVPTVNKTEPLTNTNNETAAVSVNEFPTVPTNEARARSPPPPAEPVIRACEDIRYKKFFKMLQVGVPANAVKIKMQSEGVNPTILDTPNLELPDGKTS